MNREGEVKYRYYSPVVEKITGYPPEFFEAGLENWASTIHPEDLPRVMEALEKLSNRSETSAVEEYRIHLPDGTIRWVRDSVRATTTDDDALRLDGIVSDITARKEAELELLEHRARLEMLVTERTNKLEQSRQALLRADRLASLGTLTAGLSHELNNPLGLIQLQADEALLDDDTKTYRSALASIREQVNRCADIVKGILRFSSKAESEKSPVDLSDIVQRSAEFTRRYALRRGVRIQDEIQAGQPLVWGNASELEQVLVNLLRNACESSGTGTAVVIALARFEDLLRLSVSDEGCGMTDDAVKHAFDPFYTTKRDSGGTGLGLSVVHGIVIDHNASISIQSQPGEGTTVTIEIAVCERP